MNNPTLRADRLILRKFIKDDLEASSIDRDDSVKIVIILRVQILTIGILGTCRGNYCSYKAKSKSEVVIVPTYFLRYSFGRTLKL